VAGFAEYTIVDESQIVRISKDFPMDKASLLACGVITGFGAVVNRAQVKPLSTVVVIGCGGVGLNSVQGAVISGAYPIIAIDISDNKLEAARIFGATHTVRADDKDAASIVRQLTYGRGADYVFVTVGSTAAIEQGFSISGPRGMTVVVGLPRTGSTITLPAFFPGERVITSSSMGTTRLKIDVPILIDLYKTGRLKLDELITNHYSLEQINEAIECSERGEAIRNVIMFPA
jgi:Zn-dependent alcohol dehydrogenase